MRRRDEGMGDCARCGKCCISFGVCITPFDILRIASATGRKPDEFVMSIPEPPGRQRTEPAILLEGERSLIVLRWKAPDGAGMAGTAPAHRSAMQGGRVCLFHSSEGCTIYPVRPMLCRTYPFVMERGRLADVRSRSCPSAWKPEDADGYVADTERYAGEVEAYCEIAEKWNRENPQGTLAQFIEFALAEADG
jgi:Fe-S-cluster containining protein